MDTYSFEKAAEERVQCGSRTGKAGNGFVSHAAASLVCTEYLCWNQTDTGVPDLSTIYGPPMNFVN